MLLIVAALSRELASAQQLCRWKKRSRAGDLVLWRGVCGSAECAFLRTGIGPENSGARVEAALRHIIPSLILVAGYAGALDPSLRAGDLVVSTRASLLGSDGGLQGSWDLQDGAPLTRAAHEAGLRVQAGATLTTARPILRASEKARLFSGYHAAAVDMETAAVARAACAKRIPTACVRAVTDTAAENLLPQLLNFHGRSSLAGGNLRRLFAAYFMAGAPDGLSGP